MRNLLILAVMLVSANVIGQTQSPAFYGGKAHPMDAVTFTDVKIVPITVINSGDAPQKFDITVNGNFIGETGLIGSDNRELINVPVKIAEQGKVEKFKICSTTQNTSIGVSYKTRVCTIAQLLWVK